MSDSYEDRGEYSTLGPEEQKHIASSMFTSTAMMGRMASDICQSEECGHDHEADDFEVIIPFMEMEVYYENGGNLHAFIPIQLIPGMMEAAAKTMGTMFPGWGSLSGETMQMPDSIEDWPGIDNQGES